MKIRKPLVFNAVALVVVVTSVRRLLATHGSDILVDLAAAVGTVLLVFLAAPWLARVGRLPAVRRPKRMKAPEKPVAIREQEVERESQ